MVEIDEIRVFEFVSKEFLYFHMVLNATLSRNHPMAMIEFRMVLSIL